jgi:hypothetical protein
LDDDCYLPGVKRNISEICKNASLQSSEGEAEKLRNGLDRQLDTETNAWECRKGSFANYTLSSRQFVKEIRIVFDSDLSRDHLNMVSNYTLIPAVYAPPATLVKGFHLEIDGEVFFENQNNYQRFAVIPVEKECSEIKLVIDTLDNTRETAKVFRFDFG